MNIECGVAGTLCEWCEAFELNTYHSLSAEAARKTVTASQLETAQKSSEFTASIDFGTLEEHCVLCGIFLRIFEDDQEHDEYEDHETD
jgi:hypothetical protein